MPVYLAGLVLVFAGQRALSALESGATMLTLAGAVLVLMATLVRFSPKFGAAGERGSIETLMRITSLVGLAAVAIYGVTTEWGQERFGIAAQELQSRERTLALLRVAWLVLLAVALIPMAFAEASLRPMRRAERPESRRVRAAAAAGLTLALALVYGALFVFAADTADVKVDYSYFKTSGPGEATKKMAASLQDQVQVTAFFPEVNEVKSEVEGYLKELSKAAPKLKVEMTDRLLEPKKARDLRATQDGTIVLAKGKVTRSVVVGTELDSARGKLKTLDRDLQAQLLKLARARRTVYMTVGHGELNDKGANVAEGRSAQIVQELLRKQNYTVKDLGLGQGLASELPEDADVVIVLGPTEAFAREEVAALKRWVDGGGKLLLALDPDAVSGADLVRVPSTQPAEALANQRAASDTAPAGSAPPAPVASAAAPAGSAPTAPAAAVPTASE
ncbi:MAG TPA: Gldg family protein, partial [Polyangiales bacterium]